MRQQADWPTGRTLGSARLPGRAGDVPMRDVELGYNVLWFWPIVGLFKLAGVNFLLMRGYFFALSTISFWMLPGTTS